MAAVQFARNNGMTVLGTAGTEDGMKLVQELGAHYVFNHRCEDYMDAILVSAGDIMFLFFIAFKGVVQDLQPHLHIFSRTVDI